MPVAAVPKYLRDHDLTTASPGMRFGMYLPLWGIDSRTHELLWTTHDINYRVAGREHHNKSAALKKVQPLTKSDIGMMGAVCERQAILARTASLAGAMAVIDAVATAPFTTGLGNEHPLENGFAFLNPYGLPYLPGSGVKGVLRQAARELAGVAIGARWEVESEWRAEDIDVLFGKEAKNGQEHQRGALSFWDVIPRLKGERLMVEIMTPHQSHYYQQKACAGSTAPHESGQPNPINFLTIPPGSEFAFHVQCDLAFLTRLAPDLAKDGRWQQLVRQAFEHAFAWLGFGAKTAVGYGSMALDEKRQQERQRRIREEQVAREQRQRVKEATANLPEDAAWVKERMLTNAWTDNNRFLEEVEGFLSHRETLTSESARALHEAMEARWQGIMTDPDAMKGKKKNKPKYNDRPRSLAKRLLEVKTGD